MNYKEELYKKYVSTHILPRKGSLTLAQLQERANAYQKQFGKFLPTEKNTKIIDLGCGNGSIVWWLQQKGFTNSYGIDISADYIKMGQSLGIKNLEKAEIKEFLKDKINFYDVIFARDIFEHFNKDEILEVLSLCLSSLKDNGRMILQVPNATSPFFGSIRYGDFTHEIAFTISSISQILNFVGFSDIEFYPVYRPVGSLKSIIRYLLWKVVESFYQFLLSVEIGKGKRIVTQNILVIAFKKSEAKDE